MISGTIFVKIFKDYKKDFKDYKLLLQFATGSWSIWSLIKLLDF